MWLRGELPTNLPTKQEMNIVKPENAGREQITSSPWEPIVLQGISRDLCIKDKLTSEGVNATPKRKVVSSSLAGGATPPERLRSGG